MSVTSSEGVYGVLSVTKTQRPTMGNARLAKLNDRVEKTGSGFARAAKTRAVLSSPGHFLHFTGYIVFCQGKIPLRHHIPTAEETAVPKNSNWLMGLVSWLRFSDPHFTNDAYYTHTSATPRLPPLAAPVVPRRPRRIARRVDPSYYLKVER